MRCWVMETCINFMADVLPEEDPCRVVQEMEKDPAAAKELVEGRTAWDSTPDPQDDTEIQLGQLPAVSASSDRIISVAVETR